MELELMQHVWRGRTQESHTCSVSNSVSFSHGRPMFTRLIILRSSSLHEITLATLFPFVTLLWYYNISSFLFYPHHWGQRPSTASNNLSRLWSMDSARLCTDCCVCSTQAPVFYVDCLLITCYVIFTLSFRLKVYAREK